VGTNLKWPAERIPNEGRVTIALKENDIKEWTDVAADKKGWWEQQRAKGITRTIHSSSGHGTTGD